MSLFEILEKRCHFSAAVNSYTQINLVSDGAVTAAVTDPNLLNPWGLAAIPRGPFWVADNNQGVSTGYVGSNIVAIPRTITIPQGAAGQSATPTGVVANTTHGFKIGSGRAAQPAEYIFVGEDGTVTAWKPNVDLNNALLEADNSLAGAVYKGAAMASFRGKPFLYAANFNSGAVDVFNSSFAPVALPGSFADPTLPAGFAPFNVASIQGKIFVSYALQDAPKHDPVAGAGNGYIDEFTTGGKFIKRFASQGTLNSPWAMVQAPGNFGKFRNDILVGNFGDGTINAFNPHKGKLDGQLEDPNGAVISINGLWGLSFGNGTDGKKKSLFFAAGFNDEADGLFGVLDAGSQSSAGGGIGFY